MEAARAGTDALDSRFEGLHAEATAAVGYAANTLRGVRERYRESYALRLARFQALRDELDSAPPGSPAPPAWAGQDADIDALEAAEAGAEDARLGAMRHEVDAVADVLGAYRSTLAKLELAQRTLEHIWLFLERGDGSLVAHDGMDPGIAADDLAMRIIEAQESERARLAQEIHDGPAQALSNAIFQVDFIERITPSDPTGAAVELRALRESLRRELSNVREEINQLRPPVADDAGLEAAFRDAAQRLEAATGVRGEVQLTAPAGVLDDQGRTVALRVAQEALHNVRKHAAAVQVLLRTELAAEDGSYILEIRDDGRGFDIGAVAARGRRNFGLQFMRERAELIGGRFDVRSQPGDGTVVRLTIPLRQRTGAEETT